MRLFVDLGGHDATGVNSGRIIKYDTTPEENTFTNINGQYVLEIPQGASILVDSSSYILPQNAGSIPSQAAQELLVRYPMYDHVLYNFFLENSDLSSMELGAGVPYPTPANTNPPIAGVFPAAFSRCKVGRISGPAPVGMAPNRIAILPKSAAKTTNVSGSLYSKVVDITTFNPLNPGTDEVLVWWKIVEMTTSQDTSTNFGTGINTPAENLLQDISQEPLGFSVWVSNDDGASWYEVPYLEPVDLVNAGKDIRIAFVNQGDSPVHLLGYCILFPDLP